MSGRGKEKRNFKAGINAKLIGVLIPVIAAALASILLLVYSSISGMIQRKSESLLESNSGSVVNEVRAWMNEVITALDVQRDTIEYYSMDRQEELAYIKHTADCYDAFPAGIYAATLDGELRHASFVPGPDYNVFEKPWYQDGLKSDAFVFGSVYFDEDSQNYVVGASGSLKDKEGKVCGVAAADIYLDAISDIVKNVRIEKTGGMFLVDTITNTIIGHRDTSLVGTKLGEQEDRMYSYAGDLIGSGFTGTGIYHAPAGNNVYINVTGIPDSKWIGVAYVPESEVMADLNSLTGIIGAIAVGSVLILSFLIFFLVRRVIIRPVKQIDHVAGRIAEGKLNETISYQSGDEFGRLAANFNKTVARLRDYVSYIDEISGVLDEIAEGRLDFVLKYDYSGEFARVKKSLLHISSSLSGTLSAINMAADQVAAGADQMAGGAQALSQGATEQAAGIEELAAAIERISNQVEKNAERAGAASEEAGCVGQEMTESKAQMQSMMEAMEEISRSSGEIEKIIKAIEDIAFQTNILALNASVEAARAGEAGKGFAVVAGEVRGLASKSAEASNRTAALIESSRQAVERGRKIAGATAEALLKAVDGAREVTERIEEISGASREQADSVAQVTVGIGQISDVVQTNSATAEESAASSQQLSGQAQILKELVNRFRIKEEKAAPDSDRSPAALPGDDSYRY